MLIEMSDVIKVAYPRTGTVCVASIVILLLSRYLESDSWAHALRSAVIFGVVIGLVHAFQWYQRSPREKWARLRALRHRQAAGMTAGR